MAKADPEKATKPKKKHTTTFSDERFQKAVESHPRARRALALIKGLGAVGDGILGDLKVYVSCFYAGGPQEFASAQQQTGLSRKRLDAMARNVKNVGREIHVLNSYPYTAGLDPEQLRDIEDILAPPSLHHLARASSLQDVRTKSGQVISIEDIFSLLPQVLDLYSEAMAVWPEPTVRSGQAAKQVGKNLYLIFAVAMTEKMLGSPCYTELAALVEVLHMGFGSNKTVEPGNLRKTVMAFNRRNPQIAAKVGRVSKEEWAEVYAGNPSGNGVS